MLHRRLIAYSPYLLSVVLIFAAFAPHVAFAEPPKSIELQIFEMVVNFFGMLAGLTALLLNYSIDFFVVNFGTNVTDSGVGMAVNILWSVVRDFFNIIFIFAIVYLGFRMILGSDESGTQRRLVYLILAAIMVNFSLFISKFIVDFSNILAAQVVEAAFTSDPAGGDSGGAIQVGQKFFELMGVTGTLDSSNEILNGTSSPWGYVFGIAIIFIVSAFVFIAGAILLTIRFAALCVFMVFSPFMFAGWILPQFQGAMTKYWNQFLGRAFYAPVYILMLYFSALVIQSAFARLDSQAQLGEILSDPNMIEASNSFTASMGPFILSVVMLIMSIKVAGIMSADGASMATKFVTNGSKKAGLLVPRLAARKTVGTAAKAWDKNIEQSNSKTARFTRAALSIGSLGALDARQRQQLVKAGKEAKFGLKYSTEDNDKNRVTQQKIDRERKAKSGRIEDIQKYLKTLNSMNAAAADVNEAMEKLAKVINSLSEDEVRATSYKNLTDENFAAYISDKQIETIEKSEKYSDDQIAEIKNTRKKAQINIARHATAKAGGTGSFNMKMDATDVATAAVRKQVKERLIASRKTKDVGELPVEVFFESDMYDTISPAMVENRLNNGVNDDQRKKIRDAILTHLGISGSTNPAGYGGPWEKWYNSNSTNAARLFS